MKPFLSKASYVDTCDMITGMRRTTLFCLMLLVGCDKLMPTTPTYRNQPASYWVERAQGGEIADREDAIQSLGHFKGDNEIAVLDRLVKDENVGVRYYAAEALWQDNQDAGNVVPALRSVIRDELGWSYRDRLIPLLHSMGAAAQPLIPDIQSAIDSAPNSKVAKWTKCLKAIRTS